MREIKVTGADSGQRFDKYLKKYLKEANGSFVYKMLRKKNIKLNGAKAQGSELLQTGDVITLYLSEETLDKFQGKAAVEAVVYPVTDLKIAYEDADFIFPVKPAGMLSQKAKKEDVTLVEYLLGYLQKKGAWNPLDVFTPGICNRLDRNTSGLVLAGKNLAATQWLSKILKTRELKKYYLTVVEGIISSNKTIKGYLEKNEKTNTVTVFKEGGKGRSYIETRYEPLSVSERYTLLQIELITGKTHQIRAHLSSTGHPVIGDTKYGARPYKGRRQQILHAWRLCFPENEEYPALAGRKVEAELPGYFKRIVKELFGEDSKKLF